ncbi:hypothetical protein EGW08_020973 [Elysia chlorotica]|uniref:BTB domain-containing protein n=1 Tax=Elysia chlorotica TaxID=188477 RepID=A0A3S0ZN29_ELYCH|nr:hypothetical protein EGW08_020973 [Elysia chlorotica]
MMAKQKVKVSESRAMSQAFCEKNEQERSSLRTSVAETLQNDMLRLLEEELHTDLVLTNGTDSVRAHRTVLQCRHCWKDEWLSTNSDPTSSTIEVKDMTLTQLQSFVRQLYTVSDTALLVEEFSPFFPGSNHTQAPAESPPDGEGSCSDCATSNHQAGGFSGGGDAELELDPHFQLQGFEKEQTLPAGSDGVSVVTDSCTDNTCTDHGPESVELKQSQTAKISPGDFPEECTLGPDLCGISTEKSQSPEESKGENIKSSVTENKLVCAESSLATPSDNLATCRPNSVNDIESKVLSESAFASNDDTIDRQGQKSLGTGKNCSANSCLADSKGSADRITSETSSTPHPSNLQLESVADLPHEPCSRLGADLLLMYLSQENCDCRVLVGGHSFPAHKCILSARSNYFQAMLGGHWVESQGEIICLEGVMPRAVEQLLLFLYGGVLDLTSQDKGSADLVELFLVADMYGVSDMHKVLAFELRRELCHFFHKPCQACVLSAADALSLCHNFNLKDLEQRCLRWIGKYFYKIWPSKTFAGLPDSLQQLSLQWIRSQLSTSNVLDIIVECDRLTSSLPRVKWTESVLCLLTQLTDAAIEFTSTNFVQVIRMPAFLSWVKGANWKASALEGIFTSAIDSLPIDSACNVFQALLQLQATLAQEEEVKGELSQASVDGQRCDEITVLLQAMVERCERFLRMHIHKVMRSREWPELPRPVQSRIMETSAYLSLVDLPEVKPKLVAKRPISVRHVAPPRPPAGLETRRPRPRGSAGGGVSSTIVSTRARVLVPQASSRAQCTPRSVRDQAGTRRSRTHPAPTHPGARPKTNTGARPATLLNRDVNSRVSGDMNSRDLSWNNSGHTASSLSKPTEMAQIQAEDRAKKSESFLKANCEIDSDSITHAVSTTETEKIQPESEAAKNCDWLTDATDCEMDQLPDTPSQVAVLELVNSLAACAERETSSGCSISQPDRGQSSTHGSQTLEDPTSCNINTEHHHPHRSSRMEAQGDQEESEAPQEIDTSVSLPDAGHSQLEVRTEESVAERNDRTPLARNLELEGIPPVIKIVKMSRPLSVGFVIPPN